MAKNVLTAVSVFPGEPVNFRYNAVLLTKKEYRNAAAILDKLGLPQHGDPPKNWDSLAAFLIICHEAKAGEEPIRVLDAGGEYYSAILYHLAAIGFTELYCINTSFKEASREGTISSTPGDITKTDFSDHFFDFVTCLSVIEHGVDPALFFKEMNRVIKPGGLLIISADYWQTPVDTGGKIAYGVPIKIFDEQDILTILEIAAQNGFGLMEPISLDVQDCTVKWLGLQYTFIYFTLRKLITN